MKTLFLLSIISFNLFANNILIVGDSHSVGPFGQYLQGNLRADADMVVRYAHSSSRVGNWLAGSYPHFKEVAHILMDKDNRYLRKRWVDTYSYNVPKYQNVLDKLLIHKSWQELKGVEHRIDLAIIALGANDHGCFNQKAKATCDLAALKEKFSKMAQMSSNKANKCLWVMPPASNKFSDIKEAAMFKEFAEAVSKYCQVFDSRKYISNCKDRIHFSCKQGYPFAKNWALEVAGKAKSLL